MKVKVIEGHSLNEFEEEINKFIQNKKIINIQFSADDALLALIVYEEKTSYIEPPDIFND